MHQAKPVPAYLVLGGTTKGMFIDEWPVRVFFSKEEADAWAAKAERWANRLISLTDLWDKARRNKGIS